MFRKPLRLKGQRYYPGCSSRPSASLQEPDLILAIAVSWVGVAGHDEGVVDAHARGIQQLRHGVDLVNDGHFVSGTGESPGGGDGEMMLEYEQAEMKSLINKWSLI